MQSCVALLPDGQSDRLEWVAYELRGDAEQLRASKKIFAGLPSAFGLVCIAFLCMSEGMVHA